MSPLERRAVGSLALLYSFRMLGLFMVLPLLALYAADLPGSTPVVIGLALGAYGLTQALLQVPFGLLSDRVGRKPVIVGGLLLFAAGSLLAAQADSAWQIVIGRILQGAGAIAGTVMALVADLTRDSQRTKAMALVGVSIGLSFTVALVLGPLVAAWGGLAAVFNLTAVLAVGGIALLWWRVPTPQRVAIPRGDGAGDRRPTLASLRDASLWRLNLGVFILHFVLMATFLLVPGVLEGDLGIPREAHWSVYLSALLLSLLGMVALMVLAERRGRPAQAFLIGVGLVACALLLVATGAGAWLYLALWLFFAGFNYLEATLPSLVSKTVAAAGRGAALGSFSTAQFLGAFCGGALGGWAIQYWGAPVLLYGCLGLCVLWLLVATRMQFAPLRGASDEGPGLAAESAESPLGG
jgi:predicted MFS family arabinose efflux permease